MSDFPSNAPRSTTFDAAAEKAVPKGYVLVPVEPTEHDLWCIMIAGEMDTTSPKASGLARAKAARNAMLAAMKL